MEWLNELDYQSKDESYSGQEDARRTLAGVKAFLNETDLLKGGVKITKINSQGIELRDPDGNLISIKEASDGYQAVLSMVLLMLRHLVYCYGVEKVFPPDREKYDTIDLPGVVLIDEVDAHLHPTWQTRIGEWFTARFPKLQFIVTTHSPLVCRTARKGTIWRLRKPGDDAENTPPIEAITGVDKLRLVYGNVLDAYGTGLFGLDVARAEEANKMLQELSELNLKYVFGEPMTDAELQQYERLKQIFPTHNPAKQQ